MSDKLPRWTHTLPDVLCFSHLRWNSVFQRPHHLMTRWARERRVYWIEEPVWDGTALSLELLPSGVKNIRVVVPRVPSGVHGAAADYGIALALSALALDEEIEEHIRWYY